MTTVSKETTPYSDKFKGFIDISGRRLYATCRIRQDRIIDSRPSFCCQGFRYVSATSEREHRCTLQTVSRPFSNFRHIFLGQPYQRRVTKKHKRKCITFVTSLRISTVLANYVDISILFPTKRWRDQLHLEDQGTGNTPNPSGT